MFRPVSAGHDNTRQPRLLVSTETSRALNSEAQGQWGFNAHSLVEAAGRASADVFAAAFPDYFRRGDLSRPPEIRITVAAGTGSNAADAMVMLRYWILSGLAEASSSALMVTRAPETGDKGPWAELFRSLSKLNVPVTMWNSGGGGLASGCGGAGGIRDIFSRSHIILDGITGTGLKGPLRGVAAEMAEAINAAHACRDNSPSALPCFSKKPLVVSIDLPSGNSDEWKPGMSIVEADCTLAIAPEKYCLYTPAARAYAGVILPVTGIFPRELSATYRGAELLDWENASKRVKAIRPDAYKNKRGTVEVRAGSVGAAGAAYIAARGAQAAGAGLVRLIADDEIYPLLASRASGIMVAPASVEDGAAFSAVAGIPACERRFKPDALILGPGWGRTTDRTRVIEQALIMEKNGVPLILDADAIELVRDITRDAPFSGNAILTPHPGELSRFTGIEQDELLCRPAPIILKYARERNAVILFKAHVLTIAAPDGRLAVVDGMCPGLAAGGSGDLLAGFCGAVAARMARRQCPAPDMQAAKGAGSEDRFDAYNCAAAAAALLIAAGKTLASRFTDPLELADRAADMAGAAWLGQNRTVEVP